MVHYLPNKSFLIFINDISQLFSVVHGIDSGQLTVRLTKWLYKPGDNLRGILGHLADLKQAWYPIKIYHYQWK